MSQSSTARAGALVVLLAVAVIGCGPALGTVRWVPDRNGFCWYVEAVEPIAAPADVNHPTPVQFTNGREQRIRNVRPGETTRLYATHGFAPGARGWVQRISEL